MPHSVRDIRYSCEPNIGVKGGLVFVAMKDILSGEELTIDGCLFGAPYDSDIQCKCKKENCRKVLTS